MIKKLSTVLILIIMMLCCFASKAAAVDQTWPPEKRPEDVFYIPIGDYFKDNTAAKNGTLYGWGITGVTVKGCEPESGGEEYTIGKGSTNLPTRVFDVVLDADTKSDASFYILVDVGGVLASVPSVTVGQQQNDKTAITNAYNAIIGDSYKISVQLENDTKSLNLWVYRLNTGSEPTKHTFNFSIAKPDSSGDPDPDEVESIEVTTQPIRTEYFEGQTFDRFGMAVTAWLKDGTSADVKGYSVTPGGEYGIGSEEGFVLDDEYVTVSFGDCLVELPITVLPRANISGLTISNGQMFGEWVWRQPDPNDIRYETFKRTTDFAAVALYGETAGKFSFLASEAVEIYVGSEVEKRAVSGDRYYVDVPVNTTGTVTVKAEGSDPKQYTLTCYSQAHDGMPAEITEYICPASQYTDGAFMLGVYGLNYVSTLRGAALDATTGDMYTGPASLGNFGGYITYRYDEPIKDNPRNPYGVDFIVYGNPHYPHSGFAEPGNVLVSEDGEKWYALAGSAHYEDYAKWNVSITYTKNNRGMSDWTTTLGGSGTGNKYPSKERYPLFPWDEHPGSEQQMTLTGVMLDPGSAKDAYGSASAAFPDFGYADTGARSTSNAAGNPYIGPYYAASNSDWQRSTSDGFDLKWAVDENGQPADLSDTDIYYVKIQCANNISGGAIGEKSTEVNGVRKAAPAADVSDAGVGKTTLPGKITVDGVEVILAGAESVYENVVKVNQKAKVNPGSFVVSVEATEGANVYING
jgi:hypothetical protein